MTSQLQYAVFLTPQTVIVVTGNLYLPTKERYLA